MTLFTLHSRLRSAVLKYIFEITIITSILAATTLSIYVYFTNAVYTYVWDSHNGFIVHGLSIHLFLSSYVCAIMTFRLLHLNGDHDSRLQSIFFLAQALFSILAYIDTISL